MAIERAGTVMDEKSLGKRLQQARQAAGMTQQQLCVSANLSYSTLAKIERGAIKSPSIFTIQAIAEALGTSLDSLIGAASSPSLSNRTLLKTKSGVRFIYFDVNGCLVQFYHQAFTKLGAATAAPPDLVETAFWHYNDAVCRGTMSMNDFNHALAERLGVQTINWQQFYLDAVQPVHEMHELLKWAAERYKVGLLTNIMPGFLTAMRSHGQLPDLPYDAVVDSSEVGAIKPEAKIYDIAEERAGVAPSEILLVDDSRANLIAAEKSGWLTMWFDVYHPIESTAHIRDALEPAID
ncbi:MAG TPA: HAD-IA family hydrolase [Candidatus Saccharimonadales bacterium]|nr:HAD-IA family hydrolase [Candidatus Saccharimonadales bacterium]